MITFYTHPKPEELSVKVVEDGGRTDGPYVVINFGGRELDGAMIFGEYDPEEVSATLRNLADVIDSEAERIRLKRQHAGELVAP